VQKDDESRIDASDQETLQGGALAAAMVKIALSPQKIVLLIVFLAAAFVFARLGIWQLERAYERANLAQQHELAEAAAQEPSLLGEVLAPQAPFPGSLVGQRVSVSGIYEPENQLLVVGRHVEGEVGFLVLDSLLVTDDGLGGASWSDLSGQPRLPVVRGWIPTDAVSESGQISDEWVATLQPPTSQVDLVGWLQASEAAETRSLPVGQTSALSSAQLANAWGNPIYSGYFVVQSSTPAQPGDITSLPRPSIEGSDGLNLQNLFYAIQWWVFGGFAVALWLRLVRDDAKRSAQSQPSNPFDQLDAHTR
jgi:cytochrome oxidase assembly protein ShyY1